MLGETSLREEDKGSEVRWGRGGLDRQTRPALGSTAGQDFPAVFCAHAFAEPVFPLLLEVRRLLKRERHRSHPFEQFRVNVAL